MANGACMLVNEHTAQGDTDVTKDELNKLEERARQLTREVGYVAEMNRLCSTLVNVSQAILKMMDENKQQDTTFGELVARVNGAAHAKVQLADKWLIDARPKLDRMTDKLANEVSDNA